MEDLEQSSLEEKVDLGNFVLFPLDSYVKKQRKQISDLKMNLQKSKPTMTFLKILMSKKKKMNCLFTNMKKKYLNFLPMTMKCAKFVE